MNTKASNLEEKKNNLISKIENNYRLSFDDALFIYNNFSLGLIGYLAAQKKEKLWGKSVFFNKNIHIELSNICENNCVFCSFRREKGEQGAWEMSKEEAINKIEEKIVEEITEVHIVGSLHPKYNLEFYTDLFRTIKENWKNLHIKSFTAVEIEYIAELAGISTKECIYELKKAGMDSIPGGGAEIFDATIRQKICPDKTTSDNWLQIHKEIHEAGMSSNCTMLYGHIEKPEHRIEHLIRLRDLQDQTNGFNCFIPLKYKKQNNKLEVNKELPAHEDLRMIALSRLVLDNIPHIKAYWPMLGKNIARLALHFGADDFDGTINDSTKIYSMAGADEQNPDYSAEELKQALIDEGFIPVERDSLYNLI
ncbi:MAG: aminofutalosine synthase MqnE [Bacteroidales bacterium]|nr:aminofutalosine synthase MqnE [Bacteroidales bacterium]